MTSAFYPLSPLFSHPCSSPNYLDPLLSSPLVPPPKHPTVSLVLFYCPTSHSESHTCKHSNPPPQSVRYSRDPLPSTPVVGVMPSSRGGHPSAMPWVGFWAGPQFSAGLLGCPAGAVPLCFLSGEMSCYWADGPSAIHLEIPWAGHLWGSTTHCCFSVFLCVCREQIFITQPNKTDHLRCNEGTIYTLF